LERSNTQLLEPLLGDDARIAPPEDQPAESFRRKAKGGDEEGLSAMLTVPLPSSSWEDDDDDNDA